MEDEVPFVSIIIPSFNGRDFLADCLESLCQIDYPAERHEVIIVDNASSDGSADLVRDHYPSVRILSLDRNYGFTAVNRGVEAARGEYVVVLNNDTRVRRDWLRELVSATEQVGPDNIYTSKTVWMSDNSRIDFCGGKIPITGRGFSIRYGQKDTGETECQRTGYPCAVSTLMKKGLFMEMGGFDRDFFACHDDVDLGWRAWILGHEVYLVPKSVVEHQVSGTVGPRRSYFSTYHHTKNSLQIVIKDFQPRNVVKGLFVAIIFDLREGLLSLLESETQAARARMDAYVWVLRNFEKILSKRWGVQHGRKHSDELLRTLGLYAGIGESARQYRRITRTRPENSVHRQTRPRHQT